MPTTYWSRTTILYPTPPRPACLTCCTITRPIRLSLLSSTSSQLLNRATSAFIISILIREGFNWYTSTDVLDHDDDDGNSNEWSIHGHEPYDKHFESRLSDKSFQRCETLRSGSQEDITFRVKELNRELWDATKLVIPFNHSCSISNWWEKELLELFTFISLTFTLKPSTRHSGHQPKTDHFRFVE